MTDQIFQWFAASAQTEIFGGLAAVSIVGYVLYALRAVPERIFKMWKRLCTTEMTVRSDDPMFLVVAQWLGNQGFVKNSRRLKLLTKTRRSEHPTLPTLADKVEKSPEYLFVPAPGWHYFWYKGRPVLLYIDDGQENRTQQNGFMLIENITMRTIGRHSQIFRDMLNEAIEEMKAEQRIRIATHNEYGWDTSLMKLPRPLRTVVTADDISFDLLSDMRTFLDSQQWYVERGIPWRRGYMLEGPPGTGKSSLVFALASELQVPIFSLSLGAAIGDGVLASMLMGVPECSILLIEDIDTFSMTKSRKAEKDEDCKEFITLSGLLNALDGVTAGEGRIVIMTTNHPEKLDEALTRAGRIDRHARLDYFGHRESLQMWQMFFPGVPNRHVLANMPERVQPARLQEHLTKYRNDPATAAARVSELA